MAGSKNLRINGQITVPEVRLIDGEGEQRGIVKLREALAEAQGSDLDLVEIAPQASPPVCRILNYGKYRFELEKKSREQKKNQKQVKLKEVRLQPKIEIHDLEFKSRHVQSFLDDGSKVKVTVRFRGREMAHMELGERALEKLLALLRENSYTIDNPPRTEGRFMSMLLGPKK